VAKERILVVDDEEDILELIRYNLIKEGYEVDAVTSGEDGVKAVQKVGYDLVLLDLMLPGVDGLEVCKTIKGDARIKHVPVVILSAKGEEADVVAGLELGADDYVVKPFSPRVLSARLKSVLRRSRSATLDDAAILKVDDLVINPGRHEVSIGAAPVELTSTEFKLLRFLAGKRGWVFTRSQIVDAVHGEDYPVTDRSVDVQIVGLRKKLGNYGTFIETVRGVGYRFKD
jgi:two-component system phosphate regulon response regulator PhoB